MRPPINRTSLLNYTVRIGILVFPPYAWECSKYGLERSDICPEPGLASAYMLICLQYLGLQYKIVSVSNRSGSIKHSNISNHLIKNQSMDSDITVTGTWSGLYGQLQSGEIDVIATFAGITQHRMQYFKYTRFFTDSRYLFVIRNDDLKPSEGAKLLLHGFSNDLWYTLISALILFIIAFSLIHWALQKNEQFRPRYHQNTNNCMKLIKIPLKIMWQLIRCVLSQDHEPFYDRFISSRLLFIFFAILIVIILNLYQTVVYNQISQAAKQPPFRTTEELVSLIRDGKLTLISSSPDIVYFDSVNYSQHSHFVQIREALKLNPLKVVESDEAAVELLISQNGFAYVTNEWYAYRLAANNCDLALIHLDIPTYRCAFIFSNSSPVVDLFDDAVAHSYHYLEFLNEKTKTHYARYCPNGLSALSINTMSGILITYASLMILAILVWVLEKVVWLCACGHVISP